MTEVAVVESPVEVVEHVADMRLVAADPAAMAVGQSRLTDWCQAKIRESRTALNELIENLEIAKRNKWKSSTLVNAVRRERQRVTFYGKLFAALKAGFHIIPNFDADIFAIRTERDAKGRAKSDSSWGTPVDLLPTQTAGALPEGEGVNVSPVPMGRVYEIEDLKDASGKVTKTTRFAKVTGFAEIDFPFVLAKSEILNATQQAMAMKVFDEMGVLPSRLRSRNGDPMVVGRIRKPWMKSGQADNHVTFLVVWFLDTTAL